ncbi:MAG TPA: hypothetical protein PKC38_05120 [Chitinophagales bacterium]|nr:hypothetical protein [Chitinophagales bacterium]
MIPLLFAMLLTAPDEEKLECDWIITNARIYTVDSAFSMVQSMAIDDGYIVATGSNDSVMAHYWSLNVTDMAGYLSRIYRRPLSFSALWSRFILYQSRRHKIISRCR